MNKKKTILTIITILLLLIVLFLIYVVSKKYILKNEFEKSILPFAEKNQTTIFEIKKLMLFSSSDAKNKNISTSNYTIENLYQYTDIALFISNDSEEKNLENTLKKVSIENINYTKKPLLGEPNLYFKSINNFSKSDITNENIITDKLEFNITSEDESNLDTPTLYNNLANPITLSYINYNVKSDYTLTDTSAPITYDGSLLKKCNILLNDISCSMSFDILITNNLDENFKCTVFVDIPLEDSNKTIYDGNLLLKKDTNFKFYRY